MTLIKTQFNRRSFLKVSAASTGGMMVGFNWLLSCSPASEQAEVLPPPSAWFDINAYLKVADNGQVTVMSPNPEIGQNVKTSMPMIIAEELDVAWRHVLVQQAPLNTDWYTRQVAGGSQSVRQGWDALRTAGATAKKMLIQAAAQQWQVDPSECSVSDGIITNSKGDQLGYGEVAKVAATLEVPEEVELKEPKDYKIIGKPTANVEIDNIVTGKPLFGLDHKAPGMKYVAVMRPPAFGMKLQGFDDTKAKEVKGVEQVVSFKYKEYMREEEGEIDKIAIVASSTWAALKGKKALEAQWVKGGKLENTTDHDRTLRGFLDRKTDEPARQDGNPSKAFAEADQVFEKIYEAPFLPHNCLEPMNFYANVTADKVELVGPTQTPAWTRGRIARMLNREVDQISVEMTRMGGGFGRRLYGDFGVEAAQVSNLIQAPVKVVYSREDDMSAGTYRMATKYKIRAALKGGQITGYHLIEAAVNSNMYGVLPNNFPAGAIDNYQVDNHAYQSNITTGAWRAPYTNFLGFAEQSFFDELAGILEKDPVALRLELLEAAKAKYDKIDADEQVAMSMVEEETQSEEERETRRKEIQDASQRKRGNYVPDKMIGVVKLAAEKGEWGTDTPGRHKGFSVYYSHNTYVAQVAEVEMDGNTPKVRKITCAVDCGIVINPTSAINMVQGGVVDGTGHALYGDLTFEDGKPSADNFDKFRLIRSGEAPEVQVHFVENEDRPTGLGEPALPPAGGAIANAIFRATGKRLYNQPFSKQEIVLG